MADAVRNITDQESFEHALGKALRRHHMDYSSYQKLIMLVREKANGREDLILKKARQLSKQPEEDQQ